MCQSKCGRQNEGERLAYQTRKGLKGGHIGMWKWGISKLIHNGFCFILLFKFKSLFKQK